MIFILGPYDLSIKDKNDGLAITEKEERQETWDLFMTFMILTFFVPHILQLENEGHMLYNFIVKGFKNLDANYFKYCIVMKIETEKASTERSCLNTSGVKGSSLSLR